MKTMTLSFDATNSLANSIIQLIKEVGIFHITEEKSPYNPEFVKKIQASRHSKGVVLKTDDLWK